jgi:agmatine/peptidylarginine deiminase
MKMSVKIWPLILLIGVFNFVPVIAKEAKRELVILAAPRFTDSYYAPFYDHIIKFQIEYAQKLLKNDKLLILVDDVAFKKFRPFILKENLVRFSTYDIWMRDFSPVTLRNKRVSFRYAKAAQGGSQKEADLVQNSFWSFLKQHGIKTKKSSLVLDGGNIVYSEDKAIVTDRFLQDNNLSKKEGVARLKSLLGISKVAIIPNDDPEGLAHADGMVSFVENDVLLVNQYSGEFGRRVRSELKNVFPSTKILEIPVVYGGQKVDSRFSSACGVHLNAMVTSKAIYLPTFKTPEDLKVLNLIKGHTSKVIETVDARGVCKMGGSTRCLTWQLGPTSINLRP